MANLIKVVDDFENGTKYVTYINLNNVAYIYDIGVQGTAVKVIGQDVVLKFNVPLSDFMDLVNSQE